MNIERKKLNLRYRIINAVGVHGNGVIRCIKRIQPYSQFSFKYVCVLNYAHLCVGRGFHELNPMYNERGRVRCVFVCVN